MNPMAGNAARLNESSAFHVMTKPIGPLCNLDCKYCFYLEKEKLYPGETGFQMPDEVLECYIRQYIHEQDVPEVTFAWQGGEPTLLGVGFFERVVSLQRKHCPPGKTISNALQTNGTLLDDAWCEFLRENGFLVGLSIDGPREIHDRYRVDKGGKPTFDKVMRGLEMLKRHQVEFNTLTVVSRANSEKPLEVYRFLREHGSGFMQFIPLVERTGGGDLFSAPPDPDDPAPLAPVTPWSVRPLDYGRFLCAIFDEWIRRDVGKVFVQLFEVHLGVWMGLPASLCVFSENCGRALALEHNGDLYSCDHYVYPQYRLGNIMDRPLAEMVDSAEQRKFGSDKNDRLPRYCQECDVRFACNGECPKHRFLRTPDGEPGLNYLCAGYKHFFHHVDPYLRRLAAIVGQGRPAEEIMPLIALDDRRKQAAPASPGGDGFRAGRNDPGPCGSGKKFKKCCG